MEGSVISKRNKGVLVYLLVVLLTLGLAAWGEGQEAPLR
jgi:hypothetical protein